MDQALPGVGMGPGPVPTNQATTKPRQMPGGSGGGEGFDPMSNGTDTATDDDTAPTGDDGGEPKQASRHGAYVLSDIMTEIMATNPALGAQGAFHLAKRVLDEYPLTKQAEGWNPLEFGHRGKVPDGPITRSLHKQVKKTPVPANSPSRLQETVQPTHGEVVLRDKPLEGTVVEPKEIGPAPVVEAPRKTMVMQPDGSWEWEDRYADEKVSA